MSTTNDSVKAHTLSFEEMTKLNDTYPLPKIILITGYARNGKGTVADALAEILTHRGYTPIRHALAHPLKRAVAELTGYDLETVERLKAQDTFLEEYNVTMGVLLQHIGDFVRSYEPNWLSKRAQYAINNTEPNDPGTIHIFDDVRLPEEQREIRRFVDNWNWLYHLSVEELLGREVEKEEDLIRKPITIRVERSQVNSSSRSGHATERGVEDIQPDHWIYNDGSILDLHSKVEDQIVSTYFD